MRDAARAGKTDAGRAATEPSLYRLNPSRFALVFTLILIAAGCAPRPRMLAPNEQRTVDRRLVEYPAGFAFKPYIRNLTAPRAIAFDADGSILIAESNGDDDPRIFGFRADGTRFDVYPTGRNLELPFNLGRTGYRIYGPIGGMIVYQGKIFVSHRDERGMGMITALDRRGGHSTIVADLPARGDYSMTDLAIGPGGRLFFGVGAATNSGVAGVDNINWIRDYPNFHDRPWVGLRLNGYRFDTPNPFAGLFGGNDVVVTGPFQAFGTRRLTRVPGHEKPSAAIYSCSPAGGDLQVEAHGIRDPRGLAFNGFSLYFTNDGMQMRGSRPVKDDPDALLKLVRGAWYGWPDYTAHLEPVYDPKFQPPIQVMGKSPYPEVLFLIDQQGTNRDLENNKLLEPNRDALLRGAFPSLSGAARLDFAPSSGPFRDYAGNAIIALDGDRAPYASGGIAPMRPVGYKVVRVDTDTHQVTNFINNTDGGPASWIGKNRYVLLERPVDVKFGPDGALYILDFGRMTVHNGREQVDEATGKLFRLVPTEEPTTRKSQ